ncbi:3-deoxy-7-phosphoheptulonate synthase [Sedimentisphaera salicampi]|uniref:Phospho-2-dehydro-3-deoxyheptonate aldolase n=1 Tax=Sedimentisphaera salicampi TaxID=1941349 RepID=A0A1W6LJT0_9BACT|nr:3-deoxy-7-phosphoheptulonate synthase [Sedimentisphaera salicampi]ARN56019.1 Phospho-2-dehydro-3-deoxyheptonate aldolase, Tyr-sensitive [Sedimentisphaera salicampi]OXU15932.1 Phospho-2-dehydro-3-deoxyheptonate aldolase, Tyr-sensitive [Sedimentisphaera salicampi]
MRATDNVNIVALRELTTPRELREDLPITQKQADVVLNARKSLKNIISHLDKRMVAIVGPCSIHNEDSAVEYAEKLAKIQEKTKDKLLIVMRAYFEKPRTTIGWKGLLYDPELNGSYNMKKGLHLSRKIMLSILDAGIPIATEILDPIVPQYLTDLISWSAIGARTSESQIHRQMVSGLSMPVGFKNSTDGSLYTSAQAIKTARNPHFFFGINIDGQVALAETKGNAYTHFILRGGCLGPNYEVEHIAFAEALLRKEKIGSGIVVDCSHANSRKDYKKQSKVLDNIIEQKLSGNKSIVGVMIESFLEQGSQKIGSGRLKPNVSVTDSCIGWEETEQLLMKLAEV